MHYIPEVKAVVQAESEEDNELQNVSKVQFNNLENKLSNWVGVNFRPGMWLSRKEGAWLRQEWRQYWIAQVTLSIIGQ